MSKKLVGKFKKAGLYAYSDETVQLFRGIPTTHSDAKRPVVPKQTVH